MKIGDCYSVEVVITFCVTQGSILGPKLFNIYTRTFPSKLQVVDADDHQFLKQFNLIFLVKVFVRQIFEIVES